MLSHLLSFVSRNRADMERLSEEVVNRVRAVPPERLASYARTPWIESVERGGVPYRIEVRVEVIPGVGRRAVAVRVRRGRFPWTTLTSYLPVNL